MFLCFMALMIFCVSICRNYTEQFAGHFIRLLPEDPLFRTERLQQLGVGQAICSREFPGTIFEGVRSGGGFYCKDVPMYDRLT